MPGRAPDGAGIDRAVPLERRRPTRIAQTGTAT